jgi:integrase
MALEDEIIERDPTAKLRNLKHQKPPADPFSREETETILSKLYEHYQNADVVHAAYFEFSFFTGMRPSEMLALRWGDIDLREGYARVSKARPKGRLNNRTKIAEVRDVRLNERALHALEAVKQYSSSMNECVFQSHRYNVEFKTEKSQRIIFTKVLKELGIRHRKAYNCRHTYATMLLMSGVNINFVASQLGHSPIMTATVYAKWITGEADKAEMAKLNTEVIAQKNRRKKE